MDTRRSKRRGGVGPSGFAPGGPQNKKVKLASLKYYKVGDQGKITRLRRECPEEICGAGIFMANHHDRQYCGKCGLTYLIDVAKSMKDYEKK